MDISLRKQMSGIAFIYVIMEVLTTIVQYSVIFFTSGNEGINYVLVDLILSFVPLYTVGITAAYFLFKKLPSFIEVKEKKSLTAESFFKCLIVCFSMAYIFSQLNYILMSLTEYFLQSPVIDPLEDFIENDSTQLLFFFLSSLAAPAGEEFLFRYLPYKKLIGFGTAPYIIFTSLMFALFHMNFSQLLYTFAVGLILSYIYSATGKLRYTVFIHMIINSSSGILGFLAEHDQYSALIISGVIITASFIGVIILLHHLKTEEFKENFTFKVRMNLSTWLLNPGIIAVSAISIYRSLLYF